MLTCEPPCRALAVEISPAKASVQSYEVVTFTLKVPVNSLAANYAGVLAVTDDSKKTAPLRLPVWVKPVISKLAKTIYRASPCGNCFASGPVLDVPVNGTDGKALFAGALRSDAGNIVKAHWRLQPTGPQLEFDCPPASGTYQGEIPWGPPSAKTMLNVSLTASDVVIWPLSVILLGTILAFVVKRYLGLSRITLDLRRRDAELSELSLLA